MDGGGETSTSIQLLLLVAAPALLVALEWLSVVELRERVCGVTGAQSRSNSELRVDLAGDGG